MQSGEKWKGTLQMFKGLDHVVIAVKDLDAAIHSYEEIYGVALSEREEMPAAGMKMAYFRFGDSYVELVSNVGDDGPIAKRLAARGEGLHLVAMKVDNLAETVSMLRDRGVRLVGDPGPDQEIKGQIFVHPSATGGVLTQLVER